MNHDCRLVIMTAGVGCAWPVWVACLREPLELSSQDERVWTGHRKREIVDAHHANSIRLRPLSPQVIPTPLHVLGRISPIFSPFFPFFARFHRLGEAVPTSRKPEPRAKRQWQGRPNTVSAAGLTPGVRNAWQQLRSVEQVRFNPIVIRL